jgi:cytoskeleton protein RodZ
MRERTEAPPLVTSGTISHSRYLYQRYSVSALYLILTGVIIVPAVLLAMRASLQPTATQLTSLDAPAAGAPADGAPASMSANTDAGDSTPPASAAAAEPVAANAGPDTPLVASLAPFSALSHKDPARVDTAPPVAGAHVVKLSLKEASWVEVISSAGEKLEYGLLPAGSTRTYSSDKALDVRLGNSTGAEVEADGKIQDLAPYRHANIAHFKLFSAGEPISN